MAINAKKPPLGHKTAFMLKGEKCTHGIQHILKPTSIIVVL